MNHFFKWVIKHPKTIYLASLLMVLALGAMIPNINIDTDPEAMLAEDNPQRVFHNSIKEQFNIKDSIVVGVVNEIHKDGIYNIESLKKIHELTRNILTIEGVVNQDVMSLSEVDNIRQEGAGTIRFEWLMSTSPESVTEAEAIRTAVNRLPMLTNSLVSGNGRAAAIYIPVVDKGQSYEIAQQIREYFPESSGGDQYFLTGLPIAENQFGYEMFVQMAISAPMAGMMIFFLLWVFFRNVPFIIAPMLVAMATVISTMGLLIGMGFSVHIMSSMIAIFLMPIAVVDSVHIMSEFADRYKPGEDVETVIHKVMCHLFQPMLFTSVTSTAGFFSLMLTPIPPVQIFGGFVGFGIMLAFALTMVLIPAYVVRMSPKALASLQKGHHKGDKQSIIDGIIAGIKRLALGKPRTVLTVFIALFAFSVVGLNKIVINDNPINWFKQDHEIRIADKALNKHFAGTYYAYLVFNSVDDQAYRDKANIFASNIVKATADEGYDLSPYWVDINPDEHLAEALSSRISILDDALFDAHEAVMDRLGMMMDGLEAIQEESRVFLNPEILAYLDTLEDALGESGLVGKSNSLNMVVKTVNRELRGGDEKDYLTPTTAAGVSQVLLQYQSSHRPYDLWHFVTPDYRNTLFWLQLTSGDNMHMSAAVDFVASYVADNPLPEGVAINWGGKAYLNVIWQNTMVDGMLDSLISAFVIVFIMMVFLFRSFAYGILAMVPLIFTITLIYGLIGWVGKDYDMPIAVLSALTLGMSVDFAIHFVDHTRSIHRKTGNFMMTMSQMFQEPARAISRNTFVIALGFTPLLFAPLVPYITVGIFLASIMALSGLVTLLLLPVFMYLFRKRLSLSDEQNAVT